MLQIEARSVDHFKKLNKGMENKIMELQRKLDQSVPALSFELLVYKKFLSVKRRHDLNLSS